MLTSRRLIFDAASTVSSFPGCRLATRADNERLVRFYDRQAMGTSAFEVTYQRAPDFFRLLDHHADESLVFIHEGKGGELDGIATLSLRPGYVGGEPAMVGYLADLRVLPDRQVLRLWRGLYGEIVRAAAARGCHFITAMMEDNTLARSALVSGKRGGPVYAPCGAFAMKNLLAKWPWARPPRDVTVTRATMAERNELLTFFEVRQRRRPFGFRDELQRRLERWAGLELGTFLLARRGGELVGCVAPWSPAAAKRTVVSRLPGYLGAMGKLFPRRLPRAGEPLRILYLSCFEAAEPHAARALVHAAYAVARRDGYHAAALADFDAAPLGPALRGFVSQDVRIALYTVHPPGAAPPPSPSGSIAPGFELALA